MEMKLSDLTSHAGEWLRGNGPMSEVVICPASGLPETWRAFRFSDTMLFDASCSKAYRAARAWQKRSLYAGIVSQAALCGFNPASKLTASFWWNSI